MLSFVPALSYAGPRESALIRRTRATGRQEREHHTKGTGSNPQRWAVLYGV